MRHTVTVEQLNSWVSEEQARWRTFATSVGSGSNKRLDTGPDGMFRVIVCGEVVYFGGSSDLAIQIYNERH